MEKHCHYRAVLLFLPFLIISVIVSAAYAADSENRTLKAFDGVKVSGPIKLYLSEGSSEAAKVTVEGIELEKIVTEVTGNNLEVKSPPTEIMRKNNICRIRKKCPSTLQL